MSKYARVRIPSPLPQLDKEFDYLVPEGLPISVGLSVRVPFGRPSTLKTGVIVETLDESDFADSALPIESIESKFPIISPEQYELAKQMAERYAGSVSEILSAMIPKKAVRVENTFSTNTANTTLKAMASELTIAKGDRVYLQPRIVGENNNPEWVQHFIALASKVLSSGESVLVIVPDYRDLALLEQAIQEAGLSDVAYRHSSEDKNSVRFLSHLKSMNQIGLTYGLRSTVIAPAKNLGLILILDDGDESFYEQSAPYWNVRDVALLRQELTGAAIVFSSLSPSSEVVRLVEIGYLKHRKLSGGSAICRISSGQNRLDDETYALVSKTLKEGHSVLVQIANLGYASAIACRGCGERRICDQCGAGIWIDNRNEFRCRGCKRSGPLPNCKCGGSQVKTVRIGSSSIAEWMQKAFPDAQVIHSTGEERLLEVEAGPTLVIATPGAEPGIPNGYSVVVLADAGSMLGFPTLRALEQSALRWANATSKLAKTGIVVFVGLVAELAEQAKQLDFYSMVQSDYLERKELFLPPVTRLASVTCSSAVDLQALVTEVKNLFGSGIREINTIKHDVFAFCYEYSAGKQVASELKRISSLISAKSKSRKPGQRLFRIAMDDWQVI